MKINMVLRLPTKIIWQRFFENLSLTTEITELYKILIRKFSVILQTITSGNQMNYEKLREYQTNSKNYVKLYAWYYIP
jgi:hypothetical protein